MENTQAFFGKTFFPSTRKEVRLENISLDRDRSEVTKIKLHCTMDLSDGRQVGMPSWVGDDYDRLAKLECVADTIGYRDMELAEMTVYCHATAESAKASQTLICPAIKRFCMVRGDAPKKEGGLPPVGLEFAIYANFTTESWGWLARHFRPSTFYMLFLCTQSDMNEPKSNDPQLSLVPNDPSLATYVDPEDYDAQRVEATSPVHDAEFADV